MNQANDQGRRIVQQYATLKRRLGIFTALLGILALALIIGGAAFSVSGGGYLFGLPWHWVLVAGMLLLGLIATALSLKYWRCPACSRYMGGVWFMRHCPRCGVLLDPDPRS